MGTDAMRKGVWVQAPILLAALGLAAWVGWGATGKEGGDEAIETTRAAGAACVVLPAGREKGTAMALARRRDEGTRPIPPLDAAVPERTETAAFGLG